MAVIVDFREPPIPTAESYHIGRSVASLQPTASALVHCMGWRFRPCHSMIWTYPDTGTAYNTTPGALTPTVYMRFRLTSNARYLFVAFVYQAGFGHSGGSQVALSLYSTAAALQDGPVTFDSTEGTLATAMDARIGMGGGTIEYPHVETNTGLNLRPAGEDRVGLLNVPSAVRAAKVELRFVCNDVRIRSATVWEFPTAELAG